jgi:hypothetical protein
MRLRIRATATSMLLTTGCDRCRDGHVLQAFLQAVGGRLHQAGMERRRDRQRQRALGAAALSSSQAVHAGLGAGDHGLLGIVEVGRLPPPRRWRHRRSAQPATTASASRPRMAAMAPTPTGTASCMACARRRTSGKRVGQRQRAGGHQGAVLAQRMAGHGSRHGPAFGRQAR